jgi:hypothetical protein
VRGGRRRGSLTRGRPPLQVLSADWNKYNDCIVATGSIDKSIKIWDVRVPTRELTALYGHACVARRPPLLPSPALGLTARPGHAACPRPRPGPGPG